MRGSSHLTSYHTLSYYQLSTIKLTIKMPHSAVHKSKEKKKSKGADASTNEYVKRLRAIDEEEDIPIGRITKMLRADRFMVTIYNPKKKHVEEVQAAVVDRNVQRLKPDVGNFCVIAESGKDKYEIFLPITDSDARARSNRVHESLFRNSLTNAPSDADCGIEFDYSEEETETKEVQEEKKNKKDKVSKHVERLIRDERDGDDDVNVDDI